MSTLDLSRWQLGFTTVYYQGWTHWVFRQRLTRADVGGVEADPVPPARPVGAGGRA